MAVLRIIGFETRNFADWSNVSIPAGVSFETTNIPANGGGSSLKNDGTQTVNSQFWGNLDTAPALSGNTYWMTFRAYITSASAPAADNDYRTGILFNSSGVFMGGHKLVLKAGTNAIHFIAIDGSNTNQLVADLSTVGLGAGQWIAFKVFQSPTQTIVWANGYKFDSGAVTMYPSTPAIRTMAGFATNISDSARPFYIDDIVLLDSDPGGVPFVIARQFSANGTTSNWSLVGAVGKFSNVSETPSNAANAINSSTASQVQDFVVNSFSATESGKGTGVITSGVHTILGGTVACTGSVNLTTSSGNLLKLRWRDSSAVVTSWQASNLGTTAAGIFVNLLNNGNGIFVPASITDLNGSQFGVDHDLGTRTKQVNDIWAIVAYVGNALTPLTANAGSYAMSGVAAAIKHGYAIPAGSGSYAMSGATAAVTKSTAPKVVVAGAGSYAMSGAAAGVLHGWKVSAGVGSYAMSGVVAGVLRGRKLPAGAGSYAMSGVVAGVKHNYPLVAGAGSYAMSGAIAGILRARKLPAAAGSYALTGATANVDRGARVAALPGSYAMSGTVAGILHGFKLPAGASSYQLTGTVAGVKHGWKIAAGTNAYALSGAIALVKHGWKVAAAPSSYAMSGQAAGLKHGWVLVAGAGSYAMSGVDAALSKTTGKFLAADPGAYALTGATAGVLKAWKVLAGAGHYDMLGQAATLTKSTAIIRPGLSYGDGGEVPPVHRQRDTRYDGVREAREEARRLFDEVAATPAPKRKEAAVRASEAVAKVARTITTAQQVNIAEAVPEFDLLDELEQLQAYLQGLLDQQAQIKAAQAREMADRWALIEREMMLEAAREEELMLVMALAL